MLTELELFREEEIVRIFIEGSNRALNTQGISTEKKQEIKQAVEIAFVYSPICYINELIEIKRRTIK